MLFACFSISWAEEESSFSVVDFSEWIESNKNIRNYRHLAYFFASLLFFCDFFSRFDVFLARPTTTLPPSAARQSLTLLFGFPFFFFFIFCFVLRQFILPLPLFRSFSSILRFSGVPFFPFFVIIFAVRINFVLFEDEFEMNKGFNLSVHSDKQTHRDIVLFAPSIFFSFDKKRKTEKNFVFSVCAGVCQTEKRT